MPDPLPWNKQTDVSSTLPAPHLTDKMQLEICCYTHATAASLRNSAAHVYNIALTRTVYLEDLFLWIDIALIVIKPLPSCPRLIYHNMLRHNISGLKPANSTAKPLTPFGCPVPRRAIAYRSPIKQGHANWRCRPSLLKLVNYLSSRLRDPLLSNSDAPSKLLRSIV